jgi:hypothetical protein
MNGLAIEIRRRLAEYLASEISLIEFEEWFVSKSWTVTPAAVEVYALVGSIELALAEFTSAHADEPELRSLLRPLVEQRTANSR